MKQLFSLVFLLAFIGLPLAGYASCSGQFEVKFPDRSVAGGVRTTSYNSGSSASSASFCPGATGSNQLVVKPADDGTLEITYVMNGVTYTLVPLTNTTRNQSYTYTLPTASTQVVYTLAISLPTCQNNKNNSLTLTLAPTLTLAASLQRVCQGNSVTLTAAGSSVNTANNYTWTAPGMATVTTTGTVVNGVNTSTLTQTPTATTTYTVTTTTACGGTTSQQLTVTVPTLTAGADRSAVCPGSQITLSATSSEAGLTYTWTRGGATVGSGTSLTLTPGSSGTYRVSTNTSSGCTSFVDVPVTVAAASASVDQADVAVNKGQSASITASTNLSGASYVWRSGSPGGPVVGNAATLTVAPQSTTDYYVTATSGSCSASTAARVSIIEPLPVELSWFEARATPAGHQLRWATAQETNCAYFRIEYSADGKDFAALGKVAGAGTSSKPQLYDYLVAIPRPGSSYYRLAQADTDGATHYSPVRVLEPGRLAPALTAQVFPNPLTATSVLRLRTAQAGPVSGLLHDALGRPVLRFALEASPGEQQLALPALPATAHGLHFLQLRQGVQQQVLRLQLP